MPPKTFFDRIVIRLSANAGQVKDFDLRPGSNPITNGSILVYQSTAINQTFREILLHNLTSDTVVLNLDRDPSNLMTVDLAYAFGNKTIATGAVFGERTPGGIDRLRIYFVATGVIEIILSQ